VDFKQLGLTKKLMSETRFFDVSINYQFVGRLLQRPIAFHRVFVDVADGSISAGLFLSQLYYWSDKGRDSEGWIYKTFEEWQSEIGIGRKSFEKARKVLRSKGILEEQRKGLDPRLHYRLSLEALYEAISSLDNDPQPPEPRGFPNDQKEHCLMTKRNIAQCPKGTLPNVLLADASYIQRIQTENTHREHNANSDAQEREGAGAYLCDSKSKENPEPETAADRGQDCDLEPLRKAKVIQNPEPETALQDCPSQPIGIQAKTFRNSEQNLSSPAGTNNQPSTRNSNPEETNIPPAAAKISGVEAASTLAEVPKPIPPSSSALTARFSGGADPLGDRFKIPGSWKSRKPLLDQAIAAYNQARHSSWGAAPKSPSSVFYISLDAVYKRLVSDEVPDPDQEFLLAIASATLWVGSSEYHTKPGFGNRNLPWLINSPDRILKYADMWQSKPEAEMVGAAIKITSTTGEKQYCNPEGTPCTFSDAQDAWWTISDAAIKGESVSQELKNWANYYFPKFDIYTGDDWLNG
jgi:hypothetical protein